MIDGLHDEDVLECVHKVVRTFQMKNSNRADIDPIDELNEAQQAELEEAIELRELVIAIKAAGGTLENIVMLRIYKVNYQKEDGPIISQILKDNFGTENPPASTWVSVEGLANEGFMIEIEGQGVV